MSVSQNSVEFILQTKSLGGIFYSSEFWRRGGGVDFRSNDELKGRSGRSISPVASKCYSPEDFFNGLDVQILPPPVPGTLPAEHLWIQHCRSSGEMENLNF